MSIIPGEEYVKDELRDEVAEQTEPLHRHIGPGEVDDSAESWAEISDEQIRREIAEATPHAMSDGRYDGAINQAAAKLWVLDMPRAPLEDLVYDTVEDALRHSYWPYSTTYEEAWTTATNLDVPGHYQNAAIDAARGGITRGMNPRE